MRSFVLFSLLFSSLQSLAAAAGPVPSSRATIIARLEGKEISDLTPEAGYASEDLGTIIGNSPIKSDAVRRHYQVTRYTFTQDGLVFTAYTSYLDEEDGGNTYGWIVTKKGKIAARIADSFIEAVEPADLGGGKATVELRYVTFGEESSVTKEMMSFYDTAVALDAVFDPFGAHEPKSLCFAGDVNQVCSLLSSMSKFSMEGYTDGGHGLAQLKGCRVTGHGKGIEARIELSDHYEPEATKLTVSVDACQ